LSSDCSRGWQYLHILKCLHVLFIYAQFLSYSHNIAFICGYKPVFWAKFIKIVVLATLGKWQLPAAAPGVIANTAALLARIDCLPLAILDAWQTGNVKFAPFTRKWFAAAAAAGITLSGLSLFCGGQQMSWSKLAE
jgi:hypothetical protein